MDEKWMMKFRQAVEKTPRDFRKAPKSLIRGRELFSESSQIIKLTNRTHFHKLFFGDYSRNLRRFYGDREVFRDDEEFR